MIITKRCRHKKDTRHEQQRLQLAFDEMRHNHHVCEPYECINIRLSSNCFEQTFGVDCAQSPDRRIGQGSSKTKDG